MMHTMRGAFLCLASVVQLEALFYINNNAVLHTLYSFAGKVNNVACSDIPSDDYHSYIFYSLVFTVSIRHSLLGCQGSPKTCQSRPKNLVLCMWQSLCGSFFEALHLKRHSWESCFSIEGRVHQTLSFAPF